MDSGNYNSSSSSSIEEMLPIGAAAHRRPSKKERALLQEMDNHAKDLLAFLGELEDKRTTHSLEVVCPREDKTTRDIKRWFVKITK